MHHIQKIEGLDFKSEEGCRVAEQFATDLIKEAIELSKIFTGLVRAWQDQNGFEAELPDHEFFVEVDGKYKPMVDDLFKAKVKP